MTTVGDFAKGLGHARIGLMYLMENKGLIKWAIAPLLIGFILFFFFIGTGFGLISGWVASALAVVSSGLGWIGLGGVGFLLAIVNWTLGAFLWLVYLVVVIYGTFLITTIVAAPFNSLLAEQTLMVAGGIQERPFEFGRWISVTVKMLMIGLVKSLIFLFLGLIIFACSFVPILNVASAFCALLIMAFDSMDYSFEMVEMSLRERFAFFQKHFVRFSGMASFLGLTLFLPGITLLILPFSVVGSAVALTEVRKGQ
ncbi:MAG: EI24 domain-containing protein [Pseudomonadota bacterium]